MTKKQGKIGKRGAPGRRIISTEHIGPHEVTYHATKGFRTRRTYGVAKGVAGDLYRSFIGA